MHLCAPIIHVYTTIYTPHIHLLNTSKHPIYALNTPLHGIGTHSSWGGNAVRGTDGTWNLFMAEIACAKKSDARCGLGGWGSHSQVAHAVSQSPAGPFKRVGLVAAPEHHNPTLKVGGCVITTTRVHTPRVPHHSTCTLHVCTSR